MFLIFIFGGIIALIIGAEIIVRNAINLSHIYKWSGYIMGINEYLFFVKGNMHLKKSSIKRWERSGNY